MRVPPGGGSLVAFAKKAQHDFLRVEQVVSEWSECRNEQQCIYKIQQEDVNEAPEKLMPLLGKEFLRPYVVKKYLNTGGVS